MRKGEIQNTSQWLSYRASTCPGLGGSRAADEVIVLCGHPLGQWLHTIMAKALLWQDIYAALKDIPTSMKDIADGDSSILGGFFSFWINKLEMIPTRLRPLPCDTHRKCTEQPVPRCVALHLNIIAEGNQPSPDVLMGWLDWTMKTTDL